jgi:biopolymer transport protein ExbD
MRIRHTDRRDSIVLQMTPMIDIVFQLLVFFIYTFKIVLPEGDFNIRMPAATGASAAPSENPVLKVRLRAGSERRLAAVQLGDVELAGANPFGDLQQRVRALVDDAGGPGAANQEVELDCDYDLRYQYVIRAMTAVTGYIDPATRERHKLIERVRFAPPRQN